MTELNWTAKKQRSLKLRPDFIQQGDDLMVVVMLAVRHSEFGALRKLKLNVHQVAMLH